KPNPWDFATIGKLPKHYEDFKKTVEQVESYFDAGYGFIGFITSKIDENKPAISNGNSDTVYRKVVTSNGNVYYRQFFINQDGNEDSLGFTHPPSKKDKKLRTVKVK
ncbi:MAG: hypothetical protein ACK5QC_12740, partial [Bacteroidota bacterium]